MIALLSTAALADRGGAVFTRAQMDHVDSEPLFDSEYFLDLLNFSYPVEWRDLWRSSGAAGGYRINAASLDCCALFLQQELPFQRRLTKGLTFKYGLAQNDDKDVRDFHQWLELERTLGWGVSALVFGEPAFNKEDADIGFGLAFEKGGWRASVRRYFVDFNFNQRGSSSQKYDSKPGTDQAAVAYGNGEGEIGAKLELDHPTRLSVPADNRRFSYRRTTASVHWRQGPAGGWSRRLEYEYQFQNKGDLFTPDPALKSLDSRRRTHQALAALEGPLGPRDRLEIGHNFLRRSAHTDSPTAPQNDVRYLRWEAQPYARWRRMTAPWIQTELATFLSFGEDQRRGSLTSLSKIVEAKIATGVEFIFGPAGRIGIGGAWDVDSPSHPWDGGNVRAMFFF